MGTIMALATGGAAGGAAAGAGAAAGTKVVWRWKKEENNVK